MFASRGSAARTAGAARALGVEVDGGGIESASLIGNTACRASRANTKPGPPPKPPPPPWLPPPPPSAFCGARGTRVSWPLSTLMMNISPPPPPCPPPPPPAVRVPIVSATDAPSGAGASEPMALPLHRQLLRAARQAAPVNLHGRNAAGGSPARLGLRREALRFVVDVAVAGIAIPIAQRHHPELRRRRNAALRGDAVAEPFRRGEDDVLAVGGPHRFVLGVGQSCRPRCAALRRRRSGTM